MNRIGSFSGIWVLTSVDAAVISEEISSVMRTLLLHIFFMGILSVYDGNVMYRDVAFFITCFGKKCNRSQIRYFMNGVNIEIKGYGT